MALYRAIQTIFWNDPWVVELTPEQKYFYLYLLTNPSVKQCAIYEISLKQIEYQTGYNKDTILKLLDIFENKRKIKYSLKTSEICIINFSKYNFNTSPKVIACVNKELKEVKDKSLIQYIYGIDTIYKGYLESLDTVSIESEYPIEGVSPRKRKEEEKDDEKNTDFEFFLNAFKSKLKKTELKKDSKSERQFYERISEGYTIEQMIQAIENAMTEKFHIESNYNHLTLSFITRDDILAKYSNYTPIKKTGNSEPFKILSKSYESFENAQKEWEKLIEITSSVDQAIKDRGGYNEYAQKNGYKAIIHIQEKRFLA